jgi:hypothetical protein
LAHFGYSYPGGLIIGVSNNRFDELDAGFVLFVGAQKRIAPITICSFAIGVDLNCLCEPLGSE